MLLDSTVVFNEVMYNPPGSDDTLEWVELHNQMTVDMDLSQWSIQGGADFEFPAGTTVPGGGYLVVAREPVALAAATGFADALGPLRGQLANGGERLTLRSKNDRLMDALEYGDSDPWPVGADGSGAALAKIDNDLGSSQPASWTASPQLGGTPGRDNFPSFDPTRETSTAIALDASWDYHAATAPPPADWNSLDFDSSDWAAGSGMFGAGSVAIDYGGGPIPPVPESVGVSVLNAGFEATDIQFGGGFNFYSDIPDWNDPVGGPAGIGSLLNHTSAWLNGLTPPEGSQVAFVQGPGSFRQTVDGLEVGQTYVLSYFENERDVTGRGSTYARTTVTLNGQEIVPVHQVFRTTAWRKVRSVPFVATSTTGVVELRNLGGAGDNSALFDDIRITVAGPPVANGDFETPALASGEFQLEPPGSGWTFVASGVAHAGGAYFEGNIAPPSGSQIGWLQGAAAIEQVVDGFQVGATYSLSWMHQARLCCEEPFGNDLRVTLSDAAGGQITLFDNLVVGQAWQESDVRFLATETAYTLRFESTDAVSAGSPGTDRSVLLDAVRLNFVAPPLAPVTDLPLGPTTYYFRHALSFDGDPQQAQLTFNGIVDDGAVLYLNGTEVTRINMPDGTISHATPALAPVGDPAFSGAVTISADQLVTGQNVLATEIHQATVDGGDMLFGLELTLSVGDPDLRVPIPSLAINEVGAAEEGAFFVELVNFGVVPVDVTGHVISTSGDPDRPLVIPNLPALGPGEYLTIDEQTLGLTPTAGQRVFLYGPGQTTLVDAAQVGDRPRGRLPDGQGRWLLADSATPGADNHFDLHDEIVINEIMYHHTMLISPSPLALDSSSEQWLELLNRSDQTIDLSGWRMDDAIRFDFPSGTVIGPGEYLVVAQDAAALTAKHPALAGRVVGNFAGNLSNKDDRIQLIDPLGNPADEVHYYDGGRWPSAADGGGSSLELRDPDADNAVAEAWAPSLELVASEWQTYRYRGVAVEPPGANNPSGFHELILGLLDEGEVLIDDIHVVENPEGAARERLQNGSFEGDAIGSPASTWRIIGNHSGQIIADPEDPSNQVLRLVATGPTEHMHNHAETTFADGVTIVNGGQYEISFRAKWVSGSNQLNTRLYFNRLPRTTRVDVPMQHGTPGRANSRLAENIGPTYSDFGHLPLVPSPDDVVSVFARADDPDGIAAMTLWYSVDGSAMFSAPMVRMPDGRYRGTVPRQDAETAVQFYAAGEDPLGARSTYPAAGPASRALYRVADGQIDPAEVHLLRLIMTAADSDILHTNANVMSNGRLGGTVIYDDANVFYDVGVHLRASGYGRTGPRAGFNIRFDPDHCFRGVQETIVIDRGVVLSNGDSTGVRGVAGASPHELLFDQIANRAGGIPAMVNDVVFFDAPRATNTGLGALKLARYGNDFLDAQFTDGGDGLLYKFELIYYANRTVDGDKQSLKTSPNAVTEIDIRDMGDDQEAYRLNYVVGNHRDRDDFSRIIDLGQTLSLSGDELQQRAEEVLDIDQWMRYVAMISLTGVGDTYMTDLNHNLQLYVRPEDDRVLIMPWDYDFAFFHRFDSPLTGRRRTNLSKLIERPENLRLVYGHLLDLINTSYNTTYLDPWIANYTERTGYDDLTSFFHDYVDRRVDYVLGQLASVAPQIPFQITTNGGGDLSVDQTVVTLDGTGWIDVHEVRLAGSDQPLSVTWADQDSWHVTVPVAAGPNQLQLEAYNFQGNLVGTDSITVTSSAVDPRREFLRITEINYNPYDPLVAFGDMDVDNDQFEFIELANTSTSESIDLAGVTLVDGVEFTFGDDSLPPGGRTLVVRNRDAFESRYGTGLSIAGQFVDGKLSNSGETLRLEDAAGAAIVELTYEDSDPWPGRADGKGATLELVDSEGDPSDAASWRSSSEFGGSPGRAGSGPLLDVLLNEVLARSSDGDPDQFELANTTAAPIDVALWYFGDASDASDDSDDLLKWSIPAGRSIPAGGYLVVSEDELGFALNGRQGDDLWLVAADPATGKPLRFVDHVEFGATDPGMSLGRWPDADPSGRLFPMTRPTFGQANSGPLAGEVVISELHYHPDPLRFEEDFSAAEAEGFAVQSGMWSVVDGRYGAIPDGKGDTLTTLDGLDLPPGPVTISATIRLPAASEFNRNGAIVFDCRSPTDFKFAALFANGHWRIGQRDTSGWNVLAERAETVVAEFDHRVTVEISGSRVQLLAGGSEKVRYDFAAPVTAGRVGLGSKKGEVQFDDFVVEPLDSEQFEFVELIGATDHPVDLSGWRIDGAIAYQFADGATIGPRETVVLVGFDPADHVMAAAFRDQFSIGESVLLLGPYTGRLSNGGDDVQLTRPADPGAMTTGFVLVDRVAYDDQPPWPTAADGGGHSLQRASLDAYGDFASSWTATDPTPGSSTFRVAGDMNFDGVVDGRDIQWFVLGLSDPATYAATFGVPPWFAGDLDGDGDLDFDDIGGFVTIVVSGA